MILVCVGASEFKFDRLLRILDELCEEKILDGRNLIAQIGNTEYSPIHYISFPLIDRSEFQSLIDRADFIITHSGTGSVLPALKKGKKIIIFPRLEKYREHIDDHQLELKNVFTKAGYTLSAEDKDELIDAIQNIEAFVPKTFVSNTDQFNQLLVDYIEGI